MEEVLGGIILIGLVAGGFYVVGKKMGIFDRDNSDDDFSCH
ncbi:hypothetical protein [Halonatronum saccharophilum]|nr:hypothetical protein [Halonatronum saccharophilum]